jgi:hypothetical protein
VELSALARIIHWPRQRWTSDGRSTCLPLLSAPYHKADGQLNACLLCDETQSGPVFKAVAGRTRCDSGLPNALCRPCSEVCLLVHAY